MRESRKGHAGERGISRRAFVARAGMGVAGMALARGRGGAQEGRGAALALARNHNRRAAVKAAVGLLGRMDFGGREIYLKANFNSPDSCPATTHPDTIECVVEILRTYNCGPITLVERSGMGSTRAIWERLGVPALARRLELRLMDLDELPPEEWRKEELPDSGWKNGIEVPGFLNRDVFVVQICNLKTHRFGGVFSASLKNSVGLVAKYGRVNPDYNYMSELHASPHQGAMIAEINLAYAPKLIVMDAVEVFVAGGPEAGEVATPEVVMASADRVAIDAAGVALLRLHGQGPDQPLIGKRVYEQDQLKRAVELRLGAASADEIRFLTANAADYGLASELESILRETPKTK